MSKLSLKRSTKPYVVHYAGRPAARLEIHAESPLEAAFVFFQKSPMRNSFIVRLGTERMLFFDELKKAYPEVEDILALPEAEKTDLAAEMDRHYTISAEPKDDITVGDVVAGKIIGSFVMGIIGLILIVIVLLAKKCS